MCIFEGVMKAALEASAGRSGLELLGSRPFLIYFAAQAAAMKGEDLKHKYSHRTCWDGSRSTTQGEVSLEPSDDRSSALAQGA